MSTLSSTLPVFLAACVLSLLLTPVVRRVARRLDLTDRPDGQRKLHQRVTPLGGGVAIFISALVVLLFVFPLRSAQLQLTAEHWWHLGGLLAACATIVAVGLTDDHFKLRGRQKLLGQLIASAILVASGLIIQRVQFFGWTLELGLLAIPITLFWYLGAINSVNLIDGIDGLATSVGIILSGTLAVMAWFTGRVEVALVAMVFSGTLLGFLRFNFPPASIFLGDAGSMLIGLVVGALAIQASLKGPGTVLLAAPLAVWTIPIFDSGAAILRRKLTGRSIYSTDRAHLHHRLHQRLGSHRKTLMYLAGCCALTSLAALSSVYWRSDFIALVSCASLVLIFITMRIFGDVELLLLANRLRDFSRSLVTPTGSKEKDTWQENLQLQGNRPWQILWETLTEWADRLDLYHIRLDVNMPMLGEGYHARWTRSTQTDSERLWRMEMPLVITNRLIGRLRIVGEHRHQSAGAAIEQLLELLEPFDKHLDSLAGVHAPSSAAPERAPLKKTCSQPTNPSQPSLPNQGTRKLSTAPLVSRESHEEKTPARMRKGAVAGAFAAAVLLVVTQFGVEWINRRYALAEVQRPTRPLEELPLELGSWTGEDAELDSRTFQVLGTEMCINRNYRDATGHSVALHSALWTQSDSWVPHPPDACYEAAGWTITGRKTVRLKPKDGSDQSAVSVVLLSMERDGQRIRALYWYQIGGQVYVDRDGARNIRRSYWGKPQRPALMKFLLQTLGSDSERAEARLIDIAEQTLGWSRTYR